MESGEIVKNIPNFYEQKRSMDFIDRFQYNKGYHLYAIQWKHVDRLKHPKMVIIFLGQIVVIVK